MISGCIKKIIKRSLFSLGLEIRRISKKNRLEVDKEDLVIKDATAHNTTSGVDKLYSSPEWVSEYLSPGRINFYNDVLDLCLRENIILDNKKVVDIGCGTGHLLKYINCRFHNVELFGFDHSPEAIKLSRKTCPQGKYKEFDIYGNMDMDFDVIFCIEVLEHLWKPELALKNCLNFLSRNGFFIATVPDGRKDDFLGHINFWSQESWNMFIKNNCCNYKFILGTMRNGANYVIVKNSKTP